MTAFPPDKSDSAASEVPGQSSDLAALLQSLRRKEGNWLDWGQKCQQLQKAGYTNQQIFEETGFEPIHQNQLTVAVQVYRSMESLGIPEMVRSRFEKTGSDSLYTLRILNQQDRVAAASLIVEKGIDSEGSQEVARALKEFSRLATTPEAFPDHPADAVAYYYWRLAKQQSDLQERSRLIAQALKFASSDSARRQVEQLLTDFTVTRAVTAPMLPFYRLESQSDVPRIVPVVGKLPLEVSDLQAVPLSEEEGAFSLVKFSGTGAWVAVPRWQVVMTSEDPVALLVDSDRLPEPPDGPSEELLVLVDRAERQWDEFSYFLVAIEDQLEIQWSPTLLDAAIHGKVILVMRPRKVLDEDYNRDPWQVDE
jgi:hypothetical protein